MIADTPKPPYYAVIFTSFRTEINKGYSTTANRMIELAQQQKGFLGIESAREEVGITVSYWDSLESIKQWKEHSEHKLAQGKGYSLWYQAFKVRISKVEYDYEMTINDDTSPLSKS
ncbi:MAG: antibiotic biosynthesis monooxygenase [Cytophagales bacterium]|nr:antibiotic biosynthesis monooxygenase [Cytophagales bacterium]